MGIVSHRTKYLLAILFVTAVATAGPLACTSPIPAQITLKTKPRDTATPAPVAIAPPPTVPAATASPTRLPTVPPTVPPPTATRILSATPVVSAPAAVAALPATAIAPVAPISSAATPVAPTQTVALTAAATSTAPAAAVPSAASALAAALVTPPAAAPAAGGGVKLQGAIHYDAEHGFAIVLPEGWQASVSAKDDTTYMANSEAVWKAELPPAPLVIVVTGPLDTLFTGAVAKARIASDVLMVAAGALGKDWAVKVGAPSEMTVNGYPAAIGVIEDDKPDRRPQLRGRCVSVLLQGRAAVLWTIGPQAEWQAFSPTFDGMLASVTFAEPVLQSAKGNATRVAAASTQVTTTPAPGKANAPKPTARPTTAPVPHHFPTASDLYVNGTEHYSLLAPTAWRVMEEGSMFTIAASVDDFSLPTPRGPVVEVMTGSLGQLYDGAAKGATDANGLLQVAIQVQAGRSINALGAPRPFAADGRNGLIVDVAGAGLRGQMLAVYLGGDRASLMGALAPEDQWSDFAATFQAMAGSLKFDVK